MILVLDIGNSRVKWAQWYAGKLGEYGACAHSHSDWTKQLPSARPQAIWAANVASADVLSALRRWARAHWQMEVNTLASTAQAQGIRNAYAQPERLGVDRWMACIAGYHRGNGPVLVIDAGTALTLDFVAGDGQHQGGLICPGIATMRDALLGKTQLQLDALEHGLAWLADDTNPAITLGSLHAALSLLENADRKLQPERCIITGGEAGFLRPHLPERWQYAPHLVLEGIARVVSDSSADADR